METNTGVFEHFPAGFSMDALTFNNNKLSKNSCDCVGM